MIDNHGELRKPTLESSEFARFRAEIAFRQDRKTRKKQNKLSLTTRKKRKPVSSCRENAYKKNFSTLILLISDNFLHFDSDKKKTKMTFKHRKTDLKINFLVVWQLCDKKKDRFYFSTFKTV